MKKALFIFSVFFSYSLQASPFVLSEVQPLYIDSELSSMWESLTDLYHPNVEDFMKVQNYLMHGKRPYLDVIFNYCATEEKRKKADQIELFYSRILKDIALIGPNQELPRFETQVLGGASPEDRSKCIILYASFNFNKNFYRPNDYIAGVFKLVEELQQVGYKGHVLYRLGGYPLIDKGGIRFSHIPYSFKLLSFIEASQLGYENVLWIDTTMHPTNDLEEVFSKIQREGALLLFNGINLDYDFNFIQPILPIKAIESADLNIDELNQIPHVIATIIGMSSQHQKTHELIKEWYRLTSLTIPAMTLYPEEFLLSVASWPTRNKPTGNVWEYFDVRSVIPVKPRNAIKPFWFDKS